MWEAEQTFCAHMSNLCEQLWRAQGTLLGETLWALRVQVALRSVCGEASDSLGPVEGDYGRWKISWFCLEVDPRVAFEGTRSWGHIDKWLKCQH